MSPAKPVTAHVALAVNPTALKPLSLFVYMTRTCSAKVDFYFQETNKEPCQPHVVGGDECKSI